MHVQGTPPSEKLQIKMYKMILGVNTKATNSAARAELERFPFHITIFPTILKYLFHLLNDHNENLFFKNALHTSISLMHLSAVKPRDTPGHTTGFS